MRTPLPSELIEYFQNKQVVVTGGAGFIGSHLTEALLEMGAQVMVIDNLLTGSRDNLAHLRPQFIEADVNQPVESYFPADVVPDLIFHLASPASPPKYQAKPVETYMVNSFATHHLLQFLKMRNPQARFLFASTSEVYGDPLQHPQQEGYWGNVNPNGIRSCYDEAKRLGETICGVHARDLGMDVRIIRIFNTYGPRMDLHDGRVIPNFIKEGLQNQPYQIYGDGTQTRSYCFVDDLVYGILLTMQRDSARGETINLGNPGEYTILQTAETVARIMAELNGQQIAEGVQPNIAFKPLPKDDPLRRKPDITKAKLLLNWEPTVDFVDGLRTTIAFFQK